MTLWAFIREELNHLRKKYRGWKDRTENDPEWEIY